MATIDIEYRFVLADGRTIHHAVTLDDATLRARPPAGELPDWTKLEQCQCPNCPLEAAASPRCPAAVALVPLVREVAAVPSTEQVDVTVTMKERTVSTRTSAQRAVGSLVGLLMASSGCPHTVFLSPLARYHLPFSSSQETTFRILSSWALRQVVEERKGRAKDGDLSGLLERLKDLQTVNKHMTQRLRSFVQMDAALNAVMLLDAMARVLPFEVEDDFVQLEALFAAAAGQPRS